MTSRTSLLTAAIVAAASLFVTSPVAAEDAAETPAPVVESTPTTEGEETTPTPESTPTADVPKAEEEPAADDAVTPETDPAPADEVVAPAPADAIAGLTVQITANGRTGPHSAAQANIYANEDVEVVYVFTNTSDTPITGLSIDDPTFGRVLTVAQLDPGTSVTFTATKAFVVGKGEINLTVTQTNGDVIATQAAHFAYEAHVVAMNAECTISPGGTVQVAVFNGGTYVINAPTLADSNGALVEVVKAGTDLAPFTNTAGAYLTLAKTLQPGTWDFTLKVNATSFSPTEGGTPRPLSTDVQCVGKVTSPVVLAETGAAEIPAWAMLVALGSLIGGIVLSIVARKRRDIDTV